MAPASNPHLTEAERHGMADGTLSDAHRRSAESHLARCPDCAADVGRVRALLELARIEAAGPGAAAGVTAAPLDALWPEIRERIEQGKLVPLGGEAAPARGFRRHAWPWAAGAAGLAAAAVLIALAMRGERTETTPAPRAGAALTAAGADSSGAYRRQVTALLEELELRRALLRPEVAASVDHDLTVIDDAIAELQAALRRDPKNAALQQLLAASYRQKRDLLQRVRDAS